MPLFSSGPLSYLGVDIGASGIKVVELANDNGRPRLVTYGIIENLFEQIGTIDPRDQTDVVAAQLKKLLKLAHTTTSKGIAALPTFSVFSSTLSMMPMAPKELVSAIRWEAKKIVPLPLDDMILDYKVLGEVTGQSGQSKAPANAPIGTGSVGTMPSTDDQQPVPPEGVQQQEEVRKDEQRTVRVLLTAAARDLVNRYVEVFKKASITVLSLETEAFALVRSLVGVDRTLIMIVDIGAVNSDFSIIDNGIPVMNRSIDLGGMAITRAMSEGLKLSLREAEQYKRDVGLPVAVNAPLPQYFQDVLTPIVNEIRYLLNLYQRQVETVGSVTGSRAPMKLEKIILTGGTSFLPGFVQYLSAQLNIKAYIGDPWARVIVPQELKPVLTDLGPKLSIAVGLAMREIQ
ncbi:pilus assembly protein PilM [Candidatus Uhrbacteria bacterium]|nr:pilus assembly protein PilM [Candidatus Uhrbacteria bacterium]